MSNGALSWVDHCQNDLDGVPALAGNGGTSDLAFDPAYPGANVLTADVSQVAQIDYTRNTTANTDITVTCTFSASNDKTIRVLAALNVRLPSDVVQVTAQAKNAAGTVLETGTTFTAAQLVLIPGQTDRYNLFWILSADRLGASAAFNFRFPISTTGYFEIGRLWAGPGIVWSKGVGIDWSMKVIDASRVSRADGGGFSSYALPTRKQFSITKRGLAYIDAMGDPNAPAALNVRQAVFEAGTSEPIILISTDADQHTAQVQSCYGSILPGVSLDHAGAQRYGTGMQVEEIR